MVSSSATVVSQLLPSGLVVPPLPYLLGLLAAGGAVVGLLARRGPRVTQPLVVGLAPWMVAGAALHALYQLEAVPAAVAPLTSAPAVYVTTFTAAGACWVALLTTGRDPSTPLAAVGAVAALAPSAAVVLTGLTAGNFTPFLPVAGVVASLLVAGGVYLALGRVRPDAVAATGALGALVVFAHTLDGVSTAIGVDLLGTGERSPLPRAIMDFAGGLPTAPVLGEGWLFVLVKVGVAVVVVDLFGEYVREDPFWGNTALGLVAAVGLGPGAHNILLFSVAGAI